MPSGCYIPQSVVHTAARPIWLLARTLYCYCYHGGLHWWAAYVREATILAYGVNVVYHLYFVGGVLTSALLF